MKKLQAALLVCSLLAPMSVIPRDNDPALVLSKVEEFREAFTSVPCKNEERLQAVKSLFLQMGAPETDITIEKIKDVENIVLRKQGETDEKIVIGAHYDLAGDGSCGAADNWTGIVAIAHIYRTLKDLKLKKTLLFVGFGKEELGLIGSKAMAKQIKKEAVPSYCAMVNVDGVGLNTPQSLTNVSSKKLTELSKELAKKIGVPFEAIMLNNASSDSASFKDKKIPAISIVGMINDWPKIYHTKNDQAARVNPNYVYQSYLLALTMVTTINDNACGVYR
ncbi:MAG: M20/M25/M40 family metallo-hydrolase [Blastocatellia bacterium]|nr:M20/M25/M40 family metallo-hydrolase [Blastocatellia bacterium]